MAASDALIYQLYRALSGSAYTPRSEEEKRRAAEARYASVYGEKRLTAQQSYDSEDAALRREQESLAGSYRDRKAESAAAYREALSRQDRNALSKGMQRSSYNGATLGNIALSGEAARERLSSQEAEDMAIIAQKRTDAAARLAQTLARYELGEKSDVRAYTDELTRQEEEKQAAAQRNYADLLMKLLDYQQKAEAQAQEQENWLKTFRAKYGA